MRMVKRYKNRKYYDLSSKQYVTLKDIEEYLHTEGDVQIIDNQTSEDVTRQVLVQIILQKEQDVSVDRLKGWINQGGESFKRFFSKTVEYSKDVAGKVERDIQRLRLKFLDESKIAVNNLDLDRLQKNLDAFVSTMTKFLDKRLRKELLNLPTRADVESLHTKIDKLREQIKKRENSNEGGVND